MVGEMNYAEWIWQHRQKFLSGEYTIRDMIALSISAGWTRQEIASTLRNWPRALWTRLDPEESAGNIAKQKTDHFEETLKQMEGLSLQEQWHDLYDYLSKGITWEDKNDR